MISRRDCLLLLAELQARGINTAAQTRAALNASGIDIEVLKFINSHRPMDANLFYQKIRKSYNQKRSMLYKNIVRCDEEDCTQSVLTTLAALNLQILLYSATVENVSMFLEHCRFEEINRCLHNYSKTFDLIPCIQLLQIIKADIKAFEYINSES